MDLGYETTKTGLTFINAEVSRRYIEGNPIQMTVAGRPKLHIISFAPLAYETYGTFRNRAPQLAGSFALRAFLHAPGTEGGTVIYAGLQTGAEAYGFRMNAANPDHLETFNTIAAHVGFPALKLSPFEEVRPENPSGS